MGQNASYDRVAPQFGPNEWRIMQQQSYSYRKLHDHPPPACITTQTVHIMELKEKMTLSLKKLPSFGGFRQLITALFLIIIVSLCVPQQFRGSTFVSIPLGCILGGGVFYFQWQHNKANRQIAEDWTNLAIQWNAAHPAVAAKYGYLNYGKHGSFTQHFIALTPLALVATAPLLAAAMPAAAPLAQAYQVPAGATLQPAEVLPPPVARRLLEVVIPPESAPGSTIQVRAPTGEVVEVVVTAAMVGTQVQVGY